MNEKLSISGEQFEEFRSCFDALLNNLVATMVNYGSEEGSRPGMVAAPTSSSAYVL